MRTQYVALCMFALGSAVNAQQTKGAGPNLIITHAKIFTSDRAHPWAQALAIRGDRIVAVGSNAKIKALATRSSTRIDAGGRTIIPGINDAHDHVGSPKYGIEFNTKPANA